MWLSMHEFFLYSPSLQAFPGVRITSNKPFERTGFHQFLASPAQAPCLPLKGSVGWSQEGDGRDLDVVKPAEKVRQEMIR
jgi:hypothetical protein